MPTVDLIYIICPLTPAASITPKFSFIMIYKSCLPSLFKRISDSFYVHFIIPTVADDEGVNIANFTDDDIPVFLAICVISDCKIANLAFALSRCANFSNSPFSWKTIERCFRWADFRLKKRQTGCVENKDFEKFHLEKINI